MAVKDGLPATDFSRKDREWVKNVVDGTTVPDGLPATDLSRMNREWVKAVVDEAGGGGDITVEALSVTANDTYTAPEGKAYSPVTVAVPQTTIEALSVTENNTYTAPEGKAYSPVVVNVPPSAPEYVYDVSITYTFAEAADTTPTTFYPAIMGNDNWGETAAASRRVWFIYEKGNTSGNLAFSCGVVCIQTTTPPLCTTMRKDNSGNTAVYQGTGGAIECKFSAGTTAYCVVLKNPIIDTIS